MFYILGLFGCRPKKLTKIRQLAKIGLRQNWAQVQLFGLQPKCNVAKPIFQSWIWPRMGTWCLYQHGQIFVGKTKIRLPTKHGPNCLGKVNIQADNLRPASKHVPSFSVMFENSLNWQSQARTCKEYIIDKLMFKDTVRWHILFGHLYTRSGHAVHAQACIASAGVTKQIAVIVCWEKDKDGQLRRRVSRCPGASPRPTRPSILVWARPRYEISHTQPFTSDYLSKEFLKPNLRIASWLNYAGQQ